MRYKDQLRESMQWAKMEAGYDDSLPDDEKYEKMKLVNSLFEEAKNELEAIEEEEEYTMNKYEIKYKRSWEAA